MALSKERSKCNMAYELYYAKRSAALTVRVIFQEIDLPYTLIIIDIGSESPQNLRYLRLTLMDGWQQ